MNGWETCFFNTFVSLKHFLTFIHNFKIKTMKMSTLFSVYLKIMKRRIICVICYLKLIKYMCNMLPEINEIYV